MNPEKIRLNITVPEVLAKEIDAIVGSRKRSRFITDAIREHLLAQHKKRMEQKLEEGYRTRHQESLALAQEFSSSDLEGWDEY
jgi:metal-responsive CopG/Arc/MetJ family transcriptional regulator